MFNWLKRRGGTPAQPARKPAPSKTPAAGPPRASATRPGHPRFADTAPLPEVPEVVAEGNTHADWSAWEDSMTAMDSQVQQLVPGARIYVRETRPSQLDEIDPFAGVRSKRDV
jgi:hypothetical protein